MRSPIWTMDEIKAMPEFGEDVGWSYGLIRYKGRGRLVSEHDTLEAAVMAAHAYEREVGYVEYGVSVNPVAAGGDDE